MEKAYNAELAWHSRKLLGQDAISSELSDPDILDHNLKDVKTLSPDSSHLYTPWACEVVLGEVGRPHRRCCGSCPAGHVMLLPAGA